MTICKRLKTFVKIEQESSLNKRKNWNILFNYVNYILFFNNIFYSQTLALKKAVLGAITTEKSGYLTDSRGTL